MDYKEGLFNPYVQCPYNKAHEVPKLRLQRHLLKCRKQHPHSLTMKTCPYNATHVVPGMELSLHLQLCADRNLIDGQRYSLTATHGELGNPSFHPEVPVGDWSDSDEEDHLGRNNHRHNHHQVARPVQEKLKDDGGALSQLEDCNVDPSLLGFGRGRIHRLVAEMNTRKP